ncbi:MAG: EAL domain-containing protein [Burkholderiales bacterium]|jgi:diguanylate cyclase (GGDEF)-like protein/PAS domain S-box-containing protein/excisionase family DNA binding protein|nr:EAL domain-containing protein [Burkholderiales bacterium]
MARDKLEYSIQDVSEKLGIPVQKLRRWDAQGVLVARRTEGGHRRYSKEAVDQLAATTTGTTTDEKFGEGFETARRTLKEKRRVIQLLVETQDRFRDLVETSHDLIWITDPQGRFEYLNAASQEIFGLKPDQLRHRCFFDFEHETAHVANRRFFNTLKKRGEYRNYNTLIVAADGTERWVGINARVSKDDNGTILSIRGTARDVTEQQRAAQQIEYFATHDPLTGLPNRVSLQRAVERALESGGNGAVAFIDLDHFRYVNDNVGHRRGDQILLSVAGVMKESAEARSATVYRLGGDEFAILFPGLMRPEAADAVEAVLDRLRHFPIPMPGEARVISLTASAGVALFPFHGSEAPSLLAAADIAMYQAKDSGRNRVVLYGQDGGEALKSTHKRVLWAKQLRETLDDDRIVLFAQPVVRLSDRAPAHREVLVRLEDIDGRIVPPTQFIEVAESLGMVQEIDRRVVEKLIAHLRAEAAAGRGDGGRWFVNLSRVSISDPRWTQSLYQLLTGAADVRNQIVFEITEAAAMIEVSITKSFIRELKQLGCPFALDNFGAGFSSFYYLRQFDVDYLKIDGNFVRDLTRDEANRIFVRALREVGQGLSKQVIAKWVETPEIVSLLLGMGIEYGQGYLFQHPSPLASVGTATAPTRAARSAS